MYDILIGDSFNVLVRIVLGMQTVRGIKMMIEIKSTMKFYRN